MTSNGPMGRFPAELYDLILDYYHHFDGESWCNKDVRVWGSVCRTFRNKIRPRTSHVVKLEAIDCPDSVKQELSYFRRMMTGPSSVALVDPSLTRQLIANDYRMLCMWDPVGDEIHSFRLADYTDSDFESFFPPDVPEDDYTVETSIKTVIKIMYEALSGMVNLREVYWQLSIPLTDAFEGLMPHRHEIPSSKTIAGLFVRCKDLRKIVYEDFLVTDPRPLRFMPGLEHLEIHSRAVGGNFMVRGREADNLAKEEREQYRIVAEAEQEDEDWDLHAFLQQAPSLKRLVTNWYLPLVIPANLPFWAVVDVEMVRWDLKQKDDISEVATASAVLALRPALLEMVLSLGGQLTRPDVELVLRTGHGGEQDIFAPLQKWVAADPSLIDQLLDRFNRQCREQAEHRRGPG